MLQTPNSDGLANWLQPSSPVTTLQIPITGLRWLRLARSAARTVFLSTPKSMRENIKPALQTSATRTVPCFRDRVSRAACRRSSCHGFCTLSGQFYYNMTNPAHLSGPRHLDSFIVTRNFHSSTGTGKNHATATLTATH